MGHQIASLLECLATLWTAEGFVNSVVFFIGLQIACLGECLATLRTAEWFVNSVDFFMGLQSQFLLIGLSLREHIGKSVKLPRENCRVGVV